TGGQEAGGDDAPTEIPVATIRGLNLGGRARVGRLVFYGLPLQDLDVTVDASGGRLRLAPLSAGLHGGRLRGSAAVDATGPKARVTLEQALAGVDFGALLAGVSDVKNITGTMGLDLKGSATGATDDELLRTLDGSLGFTLANGVYQGLDVWYEIRRARNLIRRQAPPAREGAEQTPIKALELAGKITDGVLRTDRFSAEIPFLRVSGDATVNLPEAKLDSQLTALVFEKPVFGEDRSLEDLVNARLPLTISGPVADPKVGVDFSKLVRDALKDNVRQKLEDKLRDKLGLPAPSTAPDGDQSAPPADDPVNKFLNRLLKKK
ncbi:MAG: AsmA family protein, partial [Gammaproteobacteria bacterium]|nr:AsmA family protein [Gammaproteobacteria bacterium]